MSEYSAKVETKLGTLVAIEDPSDSYPGIWLGLVRGDKLYELVLMEVRQDALNADEEPDLAIHQWDVDKNTVWRDPYYSKSYSKEEVDDMFGEETK